MRRKLPHGTPLIYAGRQATARLRSLGLTSRQLLTAVETGAAWAATATPNDPLGTPAILAWAKTTGALREQLARIGWTPRDSLNVPLVVHPRGLLAIVVAAGDSAVGDASRSPKLARLRGAGFAQLVDARQLRLPFLESEDQIPDTWLLLFHLPEGEEEPRLELAQPWGMRRGQVTGWAERIIIDVPRRGGQVARTPDVVDPVEPEVEVRRRRA
jgi:hypothetical protein